MQLIVIRGRSGVGKSTLAKALAEELKAPLIWLDRFKQQVGLIDYKRTQQYAYALALKEIDLLKEEGVKTVIVEDVFDDEKMIQQLQECTSMQECEIHWFHLKRPGGKTVNPLIENEQVIEHTDVIATVELITQNL